MDNFVTIIIPHLNDLAGLDRCLSCLDMQTFPRARYEVLVVDNGSSAGIQAVKRCVAGRARVLSETAAGAGPARNRGMREARGAIIAFTDADCVPASDWLERGVELVGPNEILGGRIDIFVSDPLKLSASEAFESVFAFQIERYASEESFVATANMFVPRVVARRVGDFDAIVSEDTDWCWRARAMGIGLAYSDGPLVRHPARPDWSALSRKSDRITTERFHLALRWGYNRWTWAARSTLAMASILIEIGTILSTTKLSLASQRMRATGILLIIRTRRLLLTWRLCLMGLEK